MKNSPLLSVLVAALILFSGSGCKSEFEKVRVSGDAKYMYEKANAFYAKEEWQKAQTLYELIIGSYRGQKEAEDIYYKYSYTYYNQERYVLAAYYFKNFVATYGASPKKEEADFMAAYSNYQLSPSYRLDQKYTTTAIEDMQLFVNTYPNSERVSECNRLIDEMRAKLEVKAIEEAKLYFDLRNYESAMQTFENVLRDFPETSRTEEIRYLIARAAYLYAENSFVERQQPRYEDALEKLGEFKARYMSSVNIKSVEEMYDNSRKKLNQLKNVGYQNQSPGAGL